MLLEEIIEMLSKLDPIKELEENPIPLENLAQLRKASQNLVLVSFFTRIRKMMADFGERDSDIYVVTHAKSGTTLMQMILYQMTTDGDMSFDHINDISPWLRWCVSHNLPLPSGGERRIIKAHDDYSMFQNVKKGKFISVIRDGMDVTSSYYQHIKDAHNPNLEFEAFGTKTIGEWAAYNTKWLKNENGLDLLYVNYEDLVRNKEATVRKLADFLEINLTEEILKRALERTSLKFMKQHETKFGERPKEWLVYDNFIRKGLIGEGKQKFTATQVEQYQALGKDYLGKHEVTKRYFFNA